MTVQATKTSAPITPNPRIAAIVVTFNRMALLQECVQALRSQTRTPDEIIVIDNSSTDGTSEWLSTQPDIAVVRQLNSGSSGGQYTGIKTAYRNGHDWFWCMDDDTIPCTDALERLIAAPPFTTADTGCLSSLVLGVDGNSFGSDYLLPAESASWATTVLIDRCIRVNIAPFVSLLVRRKAVEDAGLPVKDFFLMRDDWEFTERISRAFKNYCVLDSRVIHKSPQTTASEDWRQSKKLLYCVRSDVIWLRLKPLTQKQKVRELISRLFSTVYLIVRGCIPWCSLNWFVSGLFVRCRVEFPQATSLQHSLPPKVNSDGPPQADELHTISPPSSQESAHPSPQRCVP